MNPRFPLRLKILLLAVANLALLAIGLTIFVQVQLQQEFQSFLMATARERILSVARQLAIDLEEAPPEARDQLLRRYSDAQDVAFALYSAEGERLAGAQESLPQTVRDRVVRPRPGTTAGRRAPGAEGPLPPAPPFLVVTDSPRRYWVGVRISFRDQATQTFSRAIVLMVSPTLWSNPFFFQIEPWLGIAAVALLISLLCWLPWVGGLTRSITGMMKATAAVAEGRFDVHVGSSRRDELGSLGHSIDRMASRLESYVRIQKRLLGDIAHELRSPLGRMQIALGILERRASAEDLHYLKDIQEEVVLMSGLTSELLTFARAELKPEALALTSVDVGEIVQKAIRTEAGDDARISRDVPAGLRAMADADCLLRALSNLIRNAMFYAGENGSIEVAVKEAAGRVTIRVADSGPGVPEEALEKIFTPFYRLDPSRDRRSGGSGLGLAIVRSCVEACKGQVQARNQPSGGLEVSITLQPATAMPKG